LRAAESSAPTTKPSCTLIVSHDAWAPLNSHSPLNCGTTADAENHNDIASISPAANSHKLLHLALTALATLPLIGNAQYSVNTPARARDRDRNRNRAGGIDYDHDQNHEREQEFDE
jgi:hypothetical protein